MPPFRFTRLGPKGARLSDSALARVAGAMTSGEPRRDGRIPAGYTYLGQFVDHDLTFDRTEVALGERVTPAQLVQARSPSLDLDSLYGVGPQDPVSARFYEDDTHLKMGRTVAIGPDEAREGFDLPRRTSGAAVQKRKAVIPDPRNDENLAVAQTHLAFIRFHNRVVDTLPSSVPAAQRFVTAREIAVKHYQWMLRHDYLPRICDGAVVRDVFKNCARSSRWERPRRTFRPCRSSSRWPRSGSGTAWCGRSTTGTSASTSGALPRFPVRLFGLSGDLGGSPRLPSNWIADFRRLYDFGRPTGMT